MRVDSVIMMRFRPSLSTVVVALAVVGVCGCSRLPDASYTLRTAAEQVELPAKHTAQIAAYLAAFHGTLRPRGLHPAVRGLSRHDG
jgi:hypothetical protein